MTTDIGRATAAHLTRHARMALTDDEPASYVPQAEAVMAMATVGDAAVLAPDTFLMKGEDVAAGERWGGNPARSMA